MDAIKADDCMKQHMAELKDKHPEMAHDQMVAIAMSKCGEGGKALEEKAKDPASFAYVPDEKSPSTWKLDISDAEHIAGAITALSPGGFRGQKVEIPSADKKAVIAKIRARINKIVTDDTKKQNLLDRLDKVKAVAAKDMSMMLMQDEVNYGAANGQVGKACSTCRWFCAAGDMGEAHCHLVMDMPAPITPNGLCDRWESVPQMNNEPAPIPVTIVEPTDNMEMALPTNRKGLVEVIRETVQKFLNPDPPEEPAFSVYKGLDGKKYWLARHTGKFKDREGEIITDKAHEEYVARVQSGKVPMPELWVWHKKGTRHGQADVVWKSGGFTLAFGHFDDTPEADHAFRFYQNNSGKIKLSHMFHYPKQAKQNGVYHAYNTVEITTLPDGAEAFPYTSFEEFKPMALNDKDREFIKGVGGDAMLERVDAADAKAVTDTAALERSGVESKGLDNFEGATIPTTTGDVEALKAVQSDIETRLKEVESLPASIKSLQDTIVALSEQLQANQSAESAALERVNDLQRQFQEYKDLKPPASQSSDTLLSEREKSYLDQVLTQAKSETMPSLVEKMVGGQPTITNQ